MKKQLRKWAKEKRETIDVQLLSSEIQNQLFSSEIFKKAKNVMCYYSFGSEVSTINFFKDKSKKWFLPKIDGDELLICPFCSNCDVNKYGILEPNSQPVKPDVIDLIIIPALCADKNGHRIGYGKGYYDRLLKQLSAKTIKVVLVFDELYIDDVHSDFYDEKCDYIVTEKNMLKIG